MFIEKNIQRHKTKWCQETSRVHPDLMLLMWYTTKGKKERNQAEQ